MAEREYSIGELAAQAKVSRRTVRFYVVLGLISPPTGRGRGRHYTDRHLEEILATRTLQDRGLSLAEIQARKGSEGLTALLAATGPPVLCPELYTKIELSPGVWLEFRHEAAALTPGEIMELARRCREIITSQGRK
ncbi:MAG: MerR family transcriptional regulator [Desulfobaccales bacterium]